MFRMLPLRQFYRRWGNLCLSGTIKIVLVSHSVTVGSIEIEIFRQINNLDNRIARSFSERVGGTKYRNSGGLKRFLGTGSVPILELVVYTSQKFWQNVLFRNSICAQGTLQYTMFKPNTTSFEYWSVKECLYPIIVRGILLEELVSYASI